MSIVTPSTPKTSWIRDTGTIIVETTDVFIDELGNFFVDENGYNLLDSISTDGNTLSQDWDNDDSVQTEWANSFEILTTDGNKTTEQGDIRITESGDIRVMSISNSNKSLPHDWDNETNQITEWSDSFEPLTSTYDRTTEQGDSRTTADGDTRVMSVSDKNIKPITTWSEEY